MDTLVTTQWLADHPEDPDSVVVDCSVDIGPLRPERFASFDPREPPLSSCTPNLREEQ